MCEYCNKDEITLEKLEGDEEYPCEWISRGGRAGSVYGHGRLLCFRLVRRGSPLQYPQTGDRKRNG